MLKLTKAERKKFKELAQALPQTFYKAYVGTKVTGEEILKTKKTYGESKVVSGKSYVLSKEASFPVNHENRLIKAYESGGMQAVETYCREVQNLVINAHTEVNGIRLVS